MTEREQERHVGRGAWWLASPHETWRLGMGISRTRVRNGRCSTAPSVHVLPALVVVLCLAVAACGDDEGETTSTDGATSTTTTDGATTTTSTDGATTTTGEASTTTTDETTRGTIAPNTWTNLSPGGSLPLTRERGAMAYDSDNGMAILFGGWHGGVLGDTWAYDPAANTWTELGPTGAVPSPRGFHSMVYDPVGERAILFGGNDGGALGDTWA